MMGIRIGSPWAHATHLKAAMRKYLEVSTFLNYGLFEASPQAQNTAKIHELY